MKDSSSPIAAHLMALGVATVWATTFVCSKQLLEFYTPMQVMFLRFLIAYLVLWLLRPRPLLFQGREEGTLLLLGLLFFLFREDADEELLVALGLLLIL